MREDNKVGEFIKKWQKLEGLVKLRAHGNDGTKFRDDLLTIAQQDSFFAHQQLLIEDLYALRNVYSHKNRSKYIATIQDHVIKDMDETIGLLEHPPTVVDVFGCKVYSCKPSSNTIDVMNEMSDNVYTHVPIIENETVRGVFSYNSFFEWAHDVLAWKSNNRFEKTTISAIDKRYLNQPVVRYEFINASESAGKVLSIFKDRTTDQVRLDCIFITDTGKRDGELVGIITPWDLYKLW